MGSAKYKVACKYLRKMKKLRGKKEVDDLIKYFRIKYSKRRALLEELKNV